MVSLFGFTPCTSCFKAIMSTIVDFLASKFSELMISGCGASTSRVLASSSLLFSLSSASYSFPFMCPFLSVWIALVSSCEGDLSSSVSSASPSPAPPTTPPPPSPSASSSSSCSFWAWLAVVTSSGGDSESISFVICIVSSDLACGCSICLIWFLIFSPRESLVKRGSLCCSIGGPGRWSRNSFNSNFFSL